MEFATRFFSFRLNVTFAPNKRTAPRLPSFRVGQVWQCRAQRYQGFIKDGLDGVCFFDTTQNPKVFVGRAHPAQSQRFDKPERRYIYDINSYMDVEDDLDLVRLLYDPAAHA